jgi:hypothetical protein
MAAAALTPRVRMMATCDGVRPSKIEVDVFHLKGVRQAMTARALPFIPDQLWLFVLFSSPRAGEFPWYVRVVNDRTGKAILYAHAGADLVFGEDGAMCARSVPIRCAFPEEGRFTVEVWFFQEQGNDVLKGEMPFTIDFQGE